MKERKVMIPRDACRIFARLFLPDGDGRHPAVILSHGYNGSADDFEMECRFYAAQGYIACAYDFCGGSVGTRSTGLATTEMTLFTEKEDLLAVFAYVKALAEVDTERIFVFGGSQGGMVSALAAEVLQDQVRALCMYFPALCIPDNWREMYPDPETAPEVIDFWGMQLGRAFVRAVHKLDTFAAIGSYAGNVYILHGDQDPVIPMHYMEEAIAKYPHAKLTVMRGEAHGFTPSGAKLAMREVLDFMNGQ